MCIDERDACPTNYLPEQTLPEKDRSADWKNWKRQRNIKDVIVGRWEERHGRHTYVLEDPDLHAYVKAAVGDPKARSPELEIVNVGIDCKQQGLCRHRVSRSVGSFSETASGSFSVSLFFVAEPPAAGCVCYLQSMLLDMRCGSLVINNDEFGSKPIPVRANDADIKTWCGKNAKSGEGANWVFAGCPVGRKEL